MSAKDATGSSVEAGPSVRQMVALWLPLAASIVMMVLEPSIINIGLGRTTDAELALAAYGVAFSLALLVEAPILMLLDASVARSADRAAFSLLRRFALALGIIVTIVGLVVSLTPLYAWIVDGAMRIPPRVAAEARPTLQILAFWSLPIAWRRANQGLLIRLQKTTSISVATAVRLVSLAGAMFLGMALLPEQGAVVAGVAMVFSVMVEAALITLAVQSLLRTTDLPADATAGDWPTLTTRGLWRFYRPLAMTTILRQATRPFLNTGIAAAGLPIASLAAWPVVWGFAMLVTGPAWSLQQLTTALASDQAAYRRVRGFALSLSALLSLTLGIVAFTPVYGMVMGGIYNLSLELQALARPAMQLLVIYPVVMGIQSLLRGVLIRAGCTGEVRVAMTANVLTLVGALLVGVTFLSPTGVVLAAMSTLLGALVELVWLRWKT
jgi:Na+-driven multidrug efflux pump